jgi:adenylyltransferase/sulfurtransferase
MADGRYARLEQIEWWRSDLVRHATALVAGCGALGNEVLKNLLLLGWGKVIVIDLDVLELSNLSRSILFRTEDIGQSKAHVMAKRAAEINADCQVIGLHGDLRLMVSAGMVARVDIVFGCLDNIAARLALNDLIGQSKCLWIDGGLSIWEGTINLFAPGQGACYACGLTAEDLYEINLRRSCPAYAARAYAAEGVPTTPTLSSIVGAYMVQLALRWLHERHAPSGFPVSAQLRFDTAHDRFWKLGLPENPDCALHPAALANVHKDVIHFTETWAVNFQRLRQWLGTSALTVYLPVSLLVATECPECRFREEMAHVAIAEETIVCAHCSASVIPSLTNHLLGEEDFLHLSPADMGFPPWTWVTVVNAGTQEIVFELASVSPMFTACV